MTELKVSLSARAKRNLKSLLEYLENKWSERVKKKFIQKMDEAISQISKYPYSSAQSEEFKGVYRKVVSKQTSFYYRVKKEEIEIITIRDNRKDPKTLKA